MLKRIDPTARTLHRTAAQHLATNNPEIEFEGHAKIAAKLTKTRFNPSASGHGATAGQFEYCSTGHLKFFLGSLH